MTVPRQSLVSRETVREIEICSNINTCSIDKCNIQFKMSSSNIFIEFLIFRQSGDKINDMLTKKRQTWLQNKPCDTSKVGY